MVNFPGGGAARIQTAEVRGDTGGRVKVSGGDGVTYYWPSGRLRVDGLIEIAEIAVDPQLFRVMVPAHSPPLDALATEPISTATLLQERSIDAAVILPRHVRLTGNIPARVRVTVMVGASGTWSSSVTQYGTHTP